MGALNASVTVYCLIVGLGFLGLWRWYDRRDNRRFEREKRKISFHCGRCGRLYASRGSADVSDCPACGHRNARLRF
ncbi:MAG TPA: hydrogenase nickel incorporation protein HypA [Opitutaceae bacterium]|jgi:rubrerythrin